VAILCCEVLLESSDRKVGTESNILTSRSLETLAVTVVLLSLGAWGLASLAPAELELTLKIDIFSTMAQVGGVLLGLTGIFGVFLLESVRSTFRDIRRLESPVSKEELMRRFEEKQQAYQRVLESVVPMVGFLMSIICYVAEIVTAVLGLANAPNANLFNWLLFADFEFLFMGVLSVMYVVLPSLGI
jgi:hypothetical protein